MRVVVLCDLCKRRITKVEIDARQQLRPPPHMFENGLSVKLDVYRDGENLDVCNACTHRVLNMVPEGVIGL